MSLFAYINLEQITQYGFFQGLRIMKINLIFGTISYFSAD